MNHYYIIYLSRLCLSDNQISHEQPDGFWWNSKKVIIEYSSTTDQLLKSTQMRIKKINKDFYSVVEDISLPICEDSSVQKVWGMWGAKLFKTAL